MPEQRPATARRLGLAPHPEGGWFRRTWTGTRPVATSGGVRPAATCIHYLLVPGETSEWHVVTSDEIWMWHGPGTLDIVLGGESAQPAASADLTRFTLGPDPEAGHVAQVIVPGGTWQSAHLTSDDEVLLSCIVSPGFDFADWRLAD